MRRLALSLLISVLLVSAAQAATVDVKVKDNFFNPERVEIAKGDKVTWLWRGDDLHNVAIKKPNRSAISTASELQVNGRFTHRFGRVGTWRILCENHPRKMRMKVVVSP